MDTFYLIIGLIVLVLGGEFLIRGAIPLAVRMKVSMVVVGLTVVSFATSAPELIVSIYSALTGHSDIALGNVIGSNIANITLVLGVTALIFPLGFQKRLYRFDLPVMLFASALFGVFLYLDTGLNFFEGFCFVLILCFLTIYLIRYSQNNDNVSFDKNTQHNSLVKMLLYIVFGGGCLYLGSNWLVDGAAGIARSFGVSERIISVSIISFGTSVPEFAASIIAALKKEKDLSIGNLIGSNIFNVFAVLGITSMIQPIQVIDKGLINNDLWWMFGAVLLLYPLMFFFHKRHVGRIEGSILFIFYMTYIYLLF
ncbi:MAG: hypothetical protein CND86_05270 [Bacteroidetes bacterium MED-G21]|nr:MAG: hypothetical protein CND86_05270 [Bacteroidetes bacterium MED-G21]